jgi:hypothetical protein
LICHARGPAVPPESFLSKFPRFARKLFKTSYPQIDREIRSLIMTSADTTNHQDDLLTSVAESIGTTLGSLAAKATAAKEALTPSSATQARVVREAKSVRRRAKAIGRTVAKKVSAGAKKAKKAAASAKKSAKSAKKSAKKTVKKAKKVTRKVVKKARRR